MADIERRGRIDPQLEVVREEILRDNAPPCLGHLILELEEKTSHIHAGFLFDKKYGQCETWRLLMHHLCATSQYNYKADWKAFCNLLGFDAPLIESIENIQPGNEDPVTNTLRAFVQKPNATLSRVVRALVQMNREDIIRIISRSLIDLADGVLRDHEEVSNMTDSVCASSEDLQKNIITPKWLPTVPCLLKDPKQLAHAFDKVDSALILGNKTTSISTDVPKENFIPKTTPINQSSRNSSMPIRCVPFVQPIVPIQHEIAAFAESPKPTAPEPEPENRTPSTIVMLTFTSDGQKAARDLTEALRTPRNGERCGVLMLQEQQALVNHDPTAFIDGCFRKVTYIVPILTPGYLRSIDATAPNEYDATCLDTNHARYIYRLIMNEFSQNNCLNVRVRPIIPDDYVKSVYPAIKYKPVFTGFHKLSAVNNFADKILKGKI